MTTHTPSTNRWRKVIIQGLILITALLVLAWRAQPDGRLHMIFLETKGDAMLIQTSRGRYILVDGGADPAALTVALGRRIPFWQHTLSAVVLTTPDESHLPAQVAALTRYHANLIIAPHNIHRNPTVDEWLSLLSEEHTQTQVAHTNDHFDLDGAVLRVLIEGDGDKAGMVLHLDYGGTSIVLAHSGNEADEQTLAQSSQLPPASLVAFPWQRDPHNAFLAALHPRALVLTDGFTSNQPIEQTFVERAIGGATLYHEQLNGTIEWISDGRQAWVIAER